MAPPQGTDDTSRKPGEFALIEEVFAPLAAGAAGALNLKDDAALYRTAAGCETVLTVDAMIEGVHFLPDDPAGDIARKLLRVNLSDLAAKGAIPRGYLLTTAWRAETSVQWIRAFAEGLGADQAAFGISLWGGDTVSTPGPLSFSLTAIGEVSAGSMLRRDGAQAGDHLYVTGTIGDAALGLEVLRGGLAALSVEDRDYLAARYRLPEPRVSLGPTLAGLASAALDVSDGLMADAGHLCAASGVGVRIEMARVPLSVAAKAAIACEASPMEALVTGGDDYEILFAAPARHEAAIMAAAAEAGVRVTRIGILLEAGEGVSAVDAAGRPITLKQLGYRHF